MKVRDILANPGSPPQVGRSGALQLRIPTPAAAIYFTLPPAVRLRLPRPQRAPQHLLRPSPNSSQLPGLSNPEPGSQRLEQVQEFLLCPPQHPHIFPPLLLCLGEAECEGFVQLFSKSLKLF